MDLGVLGASLYQYTCRHVCEFGAGIEQGGEVCVRSFLRCEPLSLCRGVCVCLWRGERGGDGPVVWSVPVYLSRSWVSLQEPVFPSVDLGARD